MIREEPSGNSAKFDAIILNFDLIPLCPQLFKSVQCRIILFLILLFCTTTSKLQICRFHCDTVTSFNTYYMIKICKVLVFLSHANIGVNVHMPHFLLLESHRENSGIIVSNIPINNVFN